MTSPKVLLVEDDHTMVTLLHTLLRMEGFEVLEIEPGADIERIIFYIQSKKPDVILLDYHLSRFDGIDVLQRIRQVENSHTPSVIMCSGMDVSERCLDAGADDFILKPYIPDDLIARIRHSISDNNMKNRE